MNNANLDELVPKILVHYLNEDFNDVRKQALETYLLNVKLGNYQLTAQDAGIFMSHYEVEHRIMDRAYAITPRFKWLYSKNFGLKPFDITDVRVKKGLELFKNFNNSVGNEAFIMLRSLFCREISDSEAAFTVVRKKTLEIYYHHVKLFSSQALILLLGSIAVLNWFQNRSSSKSAS